MRAEVYKLMCGLLWQSQSRPSTKSCERSSMRNPTTFEYTCTQFNFEQCYGVFYQFAVAFSELHVLDIAIDEMHLVIARELGDDEGEVVTVLIKIWWAALRKRKGYTRRCLIMSGLM